MPAPLIYIYHSIIIKFVLQRKVLVKGGEIVQQVLMEGFFVLFKLNFVSIIYRCHLQGLLRTVKMYTKLLNCIEENRVNNKTKKPLHHSWKVINLSCPETPFFMYTFIYKYITGYNTMKVLYSHPRPVVL